jgi:hypothetical protein
MGEYYSVLYPTQGKSCKTLKNYYTRCVANSPHPNTVTVSFTLPKAMADAVTRRAKLELTNKSDIIRRALMAYLPPQEVAAIKHSIAQEASAPPKRRA